MMKIEDLDEDQKQRLRSIVSDFHGATNSHFILKVMFEALEKTSSQWREDLRKYTLLLEDVELCEMALNYANVERLSGN